jgi:hypothetical protein
MKKILTAGLAGLLAAALAACGGASTTTDSPVAGDENPAAAATAAQPGIEGGATGGDSAVTQPTANADEAMEEGEVSVSAIDDDPEAFYGQSVTIMGDVIEVVNPQYFRLGDPELLGGDDLLVLMPSAATAGLTDGQQVMVTGTVQQFDQTELESLLGIDIDDVLATELDGQPVIVADQVGAQGS